MIISAGLLIGGIIAAIITMAAVAGAATYVTGSGKDNSNADLNAVSAANKAAAAAAEAEAARVKKEAEDRIAELEALQKQAEQDAADAQLVADLSRDLRTNLNSVNTVLSEARAVLSTCKSKLANASATKSGVNDSGVNASFNTMSTSVGQIESHVASMEQIADDINTSLNNVTTTTVVTLSRVNAADNKASLVANAENTFDTAHQSLIDAVLALSDAADRQRIAIDAVKNDINTTKTNVNADNASANTIVTLMAPLLNHVDVQTKSYATQSSNAAKSVLADASEFNVQFQNLMNSLNNNTLNASLKSTIDNIAGTVSYALAIATEQKNLAQQAEHDYEIGLIADTAQRLQAALNSAQLKQAESTAHKQTVDSAAVLIRQYAAVVGAPLTEELEFINFAATRVPELLGEINTLITVNMAAAISADNAGAAEQHLATVVAKSNDIASFANDASRELANADQMHTEFLAQPQFGFDLGTPVTFALASDTSLGIKADGGQSDGNPHVLHDDCAGRGSCQYNVIKSQFGDQYFIQANGDPSLYMMLDEATGGERLELDNSCDTGVDNALCQWTITDDGGKYEIASLADSKLVIGADGGQDKGDRVRVDDCSGSSDCQWDISSA